MVAIRLGIAVGLKSYKDSEAALFADLDAWLSGLEGFNVETETYGSTRAISDGARAETDRVEE